MKKTFNINVAGFPFIIDDDAYTLLDNYLQTIENAFAGNDETRELANDITRVRDKEHHKKVESAA